MVRVCALIRTEEGQKFARTPLLLMRFATTRKFSSGQEFHFHPMQCDEMAIGSHKRGVSPTS